VKFMNNTHITSSLNCLSQTEAKQVKGGFEVA